MDIIYLQIAYSVFQSVVIYREAKEMANMSRCKVSLGEIIIPLMGVSFFFSIYVPMVAYVNNSQDFLQVRPWLLFGMSVGIFAVLTALLLPLLLLLKKTPRVLRYGLALLCGLTIAFYVQGNLINLNYGVLDGREIPWDKMVGAGIVNTLVWTVILFCFFAFAFFARKNFFSWLKMGMLCFLGYTSLILVMRCVTVKGRSSYPVQFTYEDFNQLSSTNNVIVIILDSFEQKLFDQLISQKPHYKDMLCDFTYYRNTIGKFPFTHLALPQILTGIAYDNSSSYEEYKDSAYLKSKFFKTAQLHNFAIDIYANHEFAPSIKVKDRYKDTLNTVAASSKGWVYLFNSMSSVYNSSLFSYLPHFFKRYHTDLFLPIFEDKVEGIECVQSATQVESKFFSHVTNRDFTLIPEKKMKFFHMVGVHLPDFNVSKAEKCIRKIIEFLDILKALKVYDCSTIFILADHGQDDRARPIFLCNNSSNGFTVSSDPFTYDSLGAVYESAMVDGKVRIMATKKRVYCYNQFYGTNGERCMDSAIARNVYHGKDMMNLRIEGFDPENEGENFWMWTNGGEAQVDIPLTENFYNQDLFIKLSCRALISEVFPRRFFEFTVNELPIGSIKFDLSSKDQSVPIFVSAKSNTNKFVRVKIKMSDLVKVSYVYPKSHDHRTLGLLINRIEVEEAKMPISAKFNLSTVNLPEVTLVTGFANPERPYGRWSDGKSASIQIFIGANKSGNDFDISFTCHPFLAGGKIPKQRMKVSSADKLLLEKSFSKEGIESFSVRLPAEVTKKGQVTLDFEFPDCASPKELGMSEDPRKLAVFFRTCEMKAVEKK